MNAILVKLISVYLTSDESVVPAIADEADESGYDGKWIRYSASCIDFVCPQEANEARHLVQKQRAQERFSHKTRPVSGCCVVPDGWPDQPSCFLTRDNTGLAPFCLRSPRGRVFHIGVEVTSKVYRQYRGSLAVRVRLLLYDGSKKPRRQRGWMFVV